MTYYDLAFELPPSELASVTPDSGAIKVYAKQPTGACVDYVVHDRADGEASFEDRTIAGFDAGGRVVNSIAHYETAIEFTDEFFIDQVSVGDAMLIDDEYMRVDGIDTGTNMLTVARGCIDTIPAPHANDALIWFQIAMPTTDLRDYATGELIHVKLLSRTTSEKLSPAIAPTDDITIAARQGRPYPPGNLKVDDVPVFNALIVEGDIVFTWAHRDRIVQGNFLLEHGAGSAGPEPGTTYGIRIYDGVDGVTLVRNTTGLTGDTWTYTTAMVIADGDLFSWWFEVESIRDGFVSTQKYRFRLQRSPGFDDSFDDNFDGGAP